MRAATTGSEKASVAHRWLAAVRRPVPLASELDLPEFKSVPSLDLLASNAIFRIISNRPRPNLSSLGRFRICPGWELTDMPCRRGSRSAAKPMLYVLMNGLSN